MLGSTSVGNLVSWCFPLSIRCTTNKSISFTILNNLNPNMYKYYKHIITLIAIMYPHYLDHPCFSIMWVRRNVHEIKTIWGLQMSKLKVGLSHVPPCLVTLATNASLSFLISTFSSSFLSKPSCKNW